jgi:thiol-disulfide isomerase/thioredoxin
VGFSALLPAADFPIGSRVADVTVHDSAMPVIVSPAKAKATVVIFVSVRCPISNSYNERMNELYKDYSNKDVQFVFVNANSNESASEIEEHSRANKFLFRVYKDQGNVLADRFGAQSTPEAYVFDRNGLLQYHGSIDDSTNPARIQVRGLRQGIDAVVEGRPPNIKETKAFGCTIKRVRKATS